MECKSGFSRFIYCKLGMYGFCSCLSFILELFAFGFYYWPKKVKCWWFSVSLYNCMIV